MAARVAGDKPCACRQLQDLLSLILKETDMKTKLLALITAMSLGALAGCNTMEGVGQDVAATGQAVEKAANNAKPN